VKYYIVAMDDDFKMSEPFEKVNIGGFITGAGSARFTDDSENLMEIHRIGGKVTALSENLARTVRLDLTKMILEGKCHSWKSIKTDLGIFDDQ